MLTSMQAKLAYVLSLREIERKCDIEDVIAFKELHAEGDELLMYSPQRVKYAFAVIDQWKWFGVCTSDALMLENMVESKPIHPLTFIDAYLRLDHEAYRGVIYGVYYVLFKTQEEAEAWYNSRLQEQINLRIEQKELAIRSRGDVGTLFYHEKLTPIFEQHGYRLINGYVYVMLVPAV